MRSMLGVSLGSSVETEGGVRMDGVDVVAESGILGWGRGTWNGNRSSENHHNIDRTMDRRQWTQVYRTKETMDKRATAIEKQRMRRSAINRNTKYAAMGYT